jgi:hypothetical protein
VDRISRASSGGESTASGHNELKVFLINFQSEQSYLFLMFPMIYESWHPTSSKRSRAPPNVVIFLFVVHVARIATRSDVNSHVIIGLDEVGG